MHYICNMIRVAEKNMYVWLNRWVCTIYSKPILYHQSANVYKFGWPASGVYTYSFKPLLFLLV